MAEPVVVDTMIASAWLGVRRSQRQIRWAPVLEQAVWVLPFVVVAEMRFGAEVAGWGARRRGVLERLVARAGVVPPLDEVTDAYVDLRAWCVRTGHGLGPRITKPIVGLPPSPWPVGIRWRPRTRSSTTWSRCDGSFPTPERVLPARRCLLRV